MAQASAAKRRSQAGWNSKIMDSKIILGRCAVRHSWFFLGRVVHENFFMLSVERLGAYETMPLPAVGARPIVTDFFKKKTSHVGFSQFG